MSPHDFILSVIYFVFFTVKCYNVFADAFCGFDVVIDVLRKHQVLLI